jgi:hypothetical protein
VQDISLHWMTSEPQRTRVDVQLVVPPMAIETTTSSCTHNACDGAFDELSVSGLNKLGGRLKLFILSEVPDNVAANNRRKAFMATQLPANCLYAAGAGCASHRAHRIITAAIEEDKLIGDVHAISFVASVPRYRATMLDKLQQLVDDELEILDFEDPDWTQQTERVVQHTLGRSFHFVRGSSSPGDAVPSEEVHKSLFKRMDNVCTFLNGDWRSPRLQHVEKGFASEGERFVSRISLYDVQCPGA